VHNGDVVSLRRLGQHLLDVLPERHALYAEDEIGLDTLEAYTGIDMTSQSRNLHLTVKQVERFLAHPSIESYEQGARYFFGHRIPD
jgi:hypothetical protein